MLSCSNTDQSIPDVEHLGYLELQQCHAHSTGGLLQPFICTMRVLGPASLSSKESCDLHAHSGDQILHSKQVQGS